VYNIIPKFKKWLTINCEVNVVRASILRCHIFQGEKIRNDYIMHCKLGTCMVIQTIALMTSFLFKEFLSFFKKLVPSGTSLNNYHLLTLDGHGSHVSLKAIKQAQ
jgi:hypothetical protein